MIDAALIETARRWLMYACLAGLAAVVLIVFCSAVLPPLCEAWRRVRAKSRTASAAFAAAVAAAILYAGTKPPSVTVTWDEYFANKSYSVDTNDLRRISFAWAAPALMPETANAILHAYSRTAGMSDVDPAASAPMATGAMAAVMPYEATNYVYFVECDWTPATAVVTNGVYHVRAVENNEHYVPIGVHAEIQERPYDAEVDYLESTGIQYIDLQVNSSADRFCDFDIKYKKISNTTPPPYGYQYGSTARYGIWSSGSAEFAGVNNSLYVEFPRDTNWNVISVRNGQYVELNGVQTSIGSGSVRSNIGVVLFGRVSSASGQSSRANSSARVGYFRLYNTSGEKIRDLIPVRFTNELGVPEGAMYDRVSGQLFRNQGAGSFILPSNQ